MMRWLYSALMWLAQPLLRIKLHRRGAREPGYRLAVGERFGRYQAASAPPGAGYLWVHAVSLGETRAAALLVARLRAQRPGLRLLLTHGTATGRAEGAGLLQPGDVQVWQPWDTPGAVRRFLDRFQPRAGVLIETEVWPNLAHQCARRGVPLLLVNARLSETSLLRALRFAPLSRPAYAALAAVHAQTAADAERLGRLGARTGEVFGNIKFDAEPDPVLLALGRRWRAGLARPVVLFASSREGEEAALLDILAAGPLPVQLLLVPRHPQRFEVVARAVQARSLRLARRSSWADAPPADADLWLGDTLGEMALYYGLADVALLGGSFEPLGGQNLIEALACGCPVVMGPHTFNFAEAAARAHAARAAWRVADLAEGWQAALRVAGNGFARARAVAAGQAFVRQHQGAAERTARAVLHYFPQAEAMARDGDAPV